jgi:hypothetical protein
MLMMLFEGNPGERVFREDALRKLARLGITTVSVLRDEETVGLVLEGWAFDPDRSAEAAHEVVAGTTVGARTFHPTTQMAVSSASTEGGET